MIKANPLKDGGAKLEGLTYIPMYYVSQLPGDEQKCTSMK